MSYTIIAKLVHVESCHGNPRCDLCRAPLSIPVTTVCMVTEFGPYRGLVICPGCLRTGSIDRKLEHAAEYYERTRQNQKNARMVVDTATGQRWSAKSFSHQQAGHALRKLIGRLKIPSYREWLESEIQYIEIYGIQQSDASSKIIMAA